MANMLPNPIAKIGKVTRLAEYLRELGPHPPMGSARIRL